MLTGDRELTLAPPLEEKKLTLPMRFFTLAVLWYYSMGGSLALRPFAPAFWVLAAAIGVGVFGLWKFPVENYSLFCLLACGALGLSILDSIDPSASLKYTLSFFLYALIAIELTSHQENIHFFLGALYVYSLFLLAVTFIQKFMPDIYLAYFSGLLPQAYRQDVLGFMERGAANGFFNQTSSNAVAMSLGAGVTLYRLLKKPTRRIWHKAILSFIFAAFLYGVALTLRRGSTLAVAAILAALLFSQRGRRLAKALALAIVLWLFVYGGARMFPTLQLLWEKSIAQLAQGDITNGRLPLWSYCFQLFAQKPAFGFGADSFFPLTGIATAHNSYIQSLVELGAIGALLFYAPFLYGFIYTCKQYRARDNYEGKNRAVLVFSLFWQTYFFSNAMFEGIFGSEITVFMLFVSQLMVIRVSQEAVL